MKNIQWMLRELKKDSVEVEVEENLSEELGLEGLEVVEVVDVKLVEELANQIDLPKLPKIPKHVAKFFKVGAPYSYEVRLKMLLDSHSGDHYYLCELFPQEGFLTEDEGEEIYVWAQEQIIEFLFKLYNGYEVEKYTVEDKYGNILLYKVTGGVGTGVRKGEIVTELQGLEEASHLLTEEEIRGFDERFWAFAEPEK